MSIGRYRVLERLGTGAMGAVYLGHDPLLKRKVAIKIVLNARVDSEVMKVRFQRESEISAQLNHPNVITVYDVGMDDTVGPFITMEFVDGGPLSNHLRGIPPTPATALDWLSQLGQALVAAEKANIVHRDIKPENMLLSSEGRLKLTDFGLARNEESDLTSTGVVMGTPTHTAPELLAGGKAGTITDRWAFAVTAFQIVTGGALPHMGDSLSALLSHIVHDPPIIPESMHAPLARVFLKALHRDPARRYDSVLAFLAALADALGARDLLDTRGLDVAAALPGRTPTAEASDGKHDPNAETGALQPGGRPPIPAPLAPSKLTAPPRDLFKGTEEPALREPERGSEGVRPAPRLPLSPPHSPQSGSRVAFVRTSRDLSLTLPLTVAGALVALAIFHFYVRTWPLRIETVPDAAQVRLNGHPVGTTPLDLPLHHGTHAINVALAGYDPENRMVEAGESRLVLDLKALPSWCDVRSTPPHAEVLLGGRSMGFTPLLGLRVPDRPAPIEICAPHHEPWRGTLGPGRPLPEIVQLTPLR